MTTASSISRLTIFDAVIANEAKTRLSAGEKLSHRNDPSLIAMIQERGNAARSGMDSLQEVVERKSAFDRNDDFTIQDKGFLTQRQRGSEHLRKIAAQILTRFRPHRHGVGISRQQATKAIPFRLVLPFFADRDSIDRSRLHSLDIVATVPHVSLRCGRSDEVQSCGGMKSGGVTLRLANLARAGLFHLHTAFAERRMRAAAMKGLGPLPLPSAISSMDRLEATE
jgi:hypothetical protein